MRQQRQARTRTPEGSAATLLDLAVLRPTPGPIHPVSLICLVEATARPDFSLFLQQTTIANYLVKTLNKRYPRRSEAGDYARLERAWGIAFWLLVVVPGPRRERGVRAALAGTGLAVATATRSGVRAPEAAVWAPLDAEGTRLRLGELAGWQRSAESVARVAEAARLRAGDPAFEGR